MKALLLTEYKQFQVTEMPEPTIDPTTRAMSAASESF